MWKRSIQNNVKLQVWDLGGQENLRSAWDSYYSNTNGVIYVVDSSDDSNALVSQLEFFNLIMNPSLKGAPVLIFANKFDLEGGKSKLEITEHLKLHEIKEHEWNIQEWCALTGEGLEEGIEWPTKKLEGE